MQSVTERNSLNWLGATVFPGGNRGMFPYVDLPVSYFISQCAGFCYLCGTAGLMRTIG